MFAHMLAIAFDCYEHSLRAMPFSCRHLPSREHDAGSQSFHIPFPRRVQGFVKVVDVEDELSFRRTESAKVADVAIATRLHAYSGFRRPCEIRCHQGSRAAKECER